MTEIEQEINTAALDLSIPESMFRRCDDAEAEIVIKKAMDTFVDDNPRVWWLSLKHPCEYIPYDDGGHTLIKSYVPPREERCWVVPETDDVRLPVFECAIDVIPAILGNCSFFEYYVIGKTFEWLIIDTDHNQLVVCKLPPLVPDPRT